jgi:capsid protein
VKSAKGSTERLYNGTSTLADECAENGKDPDEVFEQRRREHKRYVDAGMPSPFLRNAPAKPEEVDEPPVKTPAQREDA